jgi:hypothetical protein
VHFNVERRLTALVGDAGKRLHTARSRNDQVATDVRLWLRGEIDRLAGLLVALRREHAGVRARARDVRGGEPAIEVDGSGVALDALRHRLGEAARPGAGGWGAVAFRGGTFGHGVDRLASSEALVENGRDSPPSVRIRRNTGVSATSPTAPGGRHDACMPTGYAVNYKA